MKWKSVVRKSRIWILFVLRGCAPARAWRMTVKILNWIWFYRGWITAGIHQQGCNPQPVQAGRKQCPG
jgi:hypothetical protein